MGFEMDSKKIFQQKACLFFLTFVTAVIPFVCEIETALGQQQGQESYYSYVMINRAGFMRKKPVTPSGAIFKVDGNKEMISEGDRVYIRPTSNAPLILGRYYTVYRTLPPLKDPRTKIPLGVQHYLTGVVEIIRKEPRFVIATVIQSFRTIKQDDLLMPYAYRSEQIPIRPGHPDINGKIIASEEGGEMIGEGGVVFIDKGSNHGMAVGQKYVIYYQEEARPDPKSAQKILLPPVDYGELLILHTGKYLSTALVTESEQTIYTGSKFRSR